MIRRLRWRSAGLVSLLCAAAGGNAAHGQGEAPLVLRPAGPPQTVYRWATDRCEDEFIPDAPARAFRRADGQVALMATHRENWSLVGPDFRSLQPVCGATLRSSQVRPNRMGNLWIEATYTPDGRRVAAIVSEDLTARTVREGCNRQGAAGRCWLNNLLAAVSGDMGQSFTLLGRVASLGDSYPAEARRRFGVFTASNIAHRDGSFYMVAYVQGQEGQAPGNCLLRTTDPFAFDQWRGWDGQDFTVALRPGEGSARCAMLNRALMPTEIRSITFEPSRRLWIAVFQDRRAAPGDQGPVPGFSYALSPDLLRWDGPWRIMPTPLRARADSATTVTLYPSLVDPGSRSRNFDTLDSKTPWLLFTTHHLAAGSGNGTMNRDLTAVPLRLD